jgi:hypothetical protein
MTPSKSKRKGKGKGKAKAKATATANAKATATATAKANAGILHFVQNDGMGGVDGGSFPSASLGLEGSRGQWR